MIVTVVCLRYERYDFVLPCVFLVCRLITCQHFFLRKRIDNGFHSFSFCAMRMFSDVVLGGISVLNNRVQSPPCAALCAVITSPALIVLIVLTVSLQWHSNAQFESTGHPSPDSRDSESRGPPSIPGKNRGGRRGPQCPPPSSGIQSLDQIPDQKAVGRAGPTPPGDADAD